MKTKHRKQAKRLKTVPINAETLRHASLLISGIMQSFMLPELLPISHVDQAAFIHRVYSAAKLLSDDKAWVEATRAAKKAQPKEQNY